jgi:hypothetical protein
MAFLVVLRNPFLNIEMILAVVTRKGDRFVMGLLSDSYDHARA